MALIKIVGMRKLDFIDEKNQRHEFRADAINRHFIEDRHLADPFIKAFIDSGHIVAIAEPKDELAPDAPRLFPDSPPDPPDILPDGPPEKRR